MAGSALAGSHLTGAGEKFARNRALLPGLFFLFRLTLATKPLLKLAIRHPKGELRRYYTSRLKAERSNDLALKDIQALGAMSIPHDWPAANIAGTQYYLMAHHHPALLLGYFLALESGPEIADVERLEARFGVKLSALRDHAVTRVERRPELEAIIAAQPRAVRADIEWNRSGTALLLAGAVAKYWPEGGRCQGQYGD